MLKEEANELLVRVGRGTPMGEFYRRFWIPALLSSELPAPNCPPVRVRLLGEDLVAFRTTSGRVGLMDEFCPHRTASLFFGRNEGDGIRCTYHGWKFDVTGQCVDMANEAAETQFAERVKTLAYPTEERGGVVWTYMGPEGGAGELPKLEWAELPEENRYITKVEVDCNYFQAMEGDIDSSHTAFLHGKVADDSVDDGGAVQFKRERLRKYSFADRSPKFNIVDTDTGFMIGARREGGSKHYYWRITQWMMPGFSLVPKEAGNPLQCNMRIPRDDNSHFFFRAQYFPQRALTDEERAEFERGGSVFQARIPGTFKPVQTLENDFLIDRELQASGTFSGIASIPAQDQSVTVSMGPIANREKEHLATSDAAIIKVRRHLLREVKNIQAGVPGKAEPQPPERYYLRAPALLIERDIAFDVGAQKAMDANEPWHDDVDWAIVEGVE